MKVALYGGSYNPPHIGHVLAAAYLTTVAGFERVLVVPVFEHAFDKALLAYAARVDLCQRAFAQLRNVEVSAIESELPRPSYTISTVQALLAMHPEFELSLVVGADVVPEIARWHRSEELLRLAPLFVMGRHGYPALGVKRPIVPEVSSSELRALLREPATVESQAQLSYFLPAAVLTQIQERGYYR